MSRSQSRQASVIIRGAACATVAAVSVALSGCAGSEPSGSVEITVQTQVSEAPMMEVLVPAFEKANPDITVELQIITDDQKSSTNAQVISGNSAPDLALVPTNSPVYTAALQADALLPLTDVWTNQDLAERYGASTATTLTADDGVTYVATIDSLYYDIAFYNEDLFEEAGITVPSDHRIPDNDSLYDIADKLRAIGKQPLAFDGKEPARYGWMIDQLLQSAASSEQIDNYLTSYKASVPITANFTDAPFVDSVTQIESWAAKNVFQDGYLGQDDPTAAGLFLQSGAGMYLGGNFSVPDINDAGLNFGWLLLPPVAGGAKVALPSYHGESMAVPVKAKHPDEAKKFLEFWLTDEMQTAAVGNSGFGLPTVNTVPVDELTLDPAVLEMVEDANENGSPSGWTSAVPGAYGQTTVGTNIASLLTGALTVEQVAQAQQDALIDIRAEN